MNSFAPARGDKMAMRPFVKLLDHNPCRRLSRWGGGVYLCLFVCLFLPHDISKTAAARITRLDMEVTETFYDKSWKPIYFGSQRYQVTKNIAGVGHCTLSCECWLRLVIIYCDYQIVPPPASDSASACVTMHHLPPLHPVQRYCN